MAKDKEMIPVTDAQAKAIEESAKAGQQALKVLESLGGYLNQVFGTVPSDLVGILGGDWLKVRRAENLVQILRRAKERLDARGTNPVDPPTLSLTLPLMQAASDENRDELQDIWARLLAAATDPNRQQSFRTVFIDIAKKMDPLDAVVLQETSTKEKWVKNLIDPKQADIQMHSARVKFRTGMPERLGLSRDEVTVSLFHLESMNLVENAQQGSDLEVSPLGREFLRALAD